MCVERSTVDVAFVRSGPTSCQALRGGKLSGRLQESLDRVCVAVRLCTNDAAPTKDCLVADEQKAILAARAVDFGPLPRCRVHLDVYCQGWWRHHVHGSGGLAPGRSAMPARTPHSNVYPTRSYAHVSTPHATEQAWQLAPSIALAPDTRRSSAASARSTTAITATLRAPRPPGLLGDAARVRVSRRAGDQYGPSRTCFVGRCSHPAVRCVP